MPRTKAKAKETRTPTEQLAACVRWFDYMDDTFNNSLRSPQDALKLWLYAQAHPDLPEMCDGGDGQDSLWPDDHYIKALGYIPDGLRKPL